ncbi:reverse transcriptase N-terminal domain-containing protein [Orientia tsutsugamushi]
MIHSFCGKALAVRRVIEILSKRTAGIDKEILNTLILNLRQ